MHARRPRCPPPVSEPQRACSSSKSEVGAWQDWGGTQGWLQRVGWVAGLPMEAVIHIILRERGRRWGKTTGLGGLGDGWPGCPGADSRRGVAAAPVTAAEGACSGDCWFGCWLGPSKCDPVR